MNTDEYKPWANKLMSSQTDPSIMSFGALIPSPFPPNVQVVSGTTVIAPTCDSLWGCRQDYACVDRHKPVHTVALICHWRTLVRAAPFHRSPSFTRSLPWMLYEVLTTALAALS